MNRRDFACLAGNDSVAFRTGPSNWADFEDLVKTWAKASVAGLNELRAMPQVAVAGPPG